MKFTILGYRQDVLLEYKLDIKDAALLRFIIDFKDSGDMTIKIINGKPFYWIKYKYIIEQMPLLEIKSKDVLRRRLKKLEECNVLIHETIKNKGTFSFYGVGPNYSRLISTTQKSDRVRLKSSTLPTQKSYPSDLKVGTNNSSIKDSSIKDSSSVVQEEKINKDILNKIISAWNSLELSKIKAINKNTKRYKYLNARLQEFSVKDILEAINNIKKSKFLHGNNKRNWQIDFDWFILPSNFIKVFEGKYMDKEENKNGNCGKSAFKYSGGSSKDREKFEIRNSKAKEYTDEEREAAGIL